MSTQTLVKATFQFDTSSPTIAQSSTTLSGTITSGATTLTLAASYTPPNNSYITIQAEGGNTTESVLVTAGSGTATLTIVRGQLGTAPSAHNSGATVTIPGKNTFNLLPISQQPNNTLFLHKKSTDINYQVILCAGGDTFPGGGTTLILPDTSPNLGTALLKAPDDGSGVWILLAGAGATGATGSAGTPTTLVLSFSGSNATVGQAYNGALTATGGVQPYTYSISSGSLPAGLSLDPGSGAITGNPTGPGSVTFTAKVTDSASTTATLSCTINTQGADAFTIGTLSYSWVPPTQLDAGANNELLIYVPVTPPSPLNGVLGGHLYAEIPDKSYDANQFVIGISAIGTGRVSGPWNPQDQGQFPLSAIATLPDGAGDSGWTIKLANVNITAASNIRVYVQPYAASYDLPPVEANTPGATPSAVVTVQPDASAKPDSGANVTPYLVTGLSASAGAATSIAGQAVIPITCTVDISGVPNPLPQGWTYELWAYVSSDTSFTNLLAKLGPLSAGGSQALNIPELALVSSLNKSVPISIYAVAGLAHYTNAQRGLIDFNPNNIVIGITASATVTLQPGTPLNDGAVLAITDANGNPPTQQSIFQGTNSLGKPYWAWAIQIQTPGWNDVGSGGYELWGAWVDSSGNLVVPGGYGNPATKVWQKIGWVVNDGTLQSFGGGLSGDYNYPSIDCYFEFVVVGRSIGSTGGSYPYTGDTSAVPQLWPTGLAYERLHVGLPPGAPGVTNPVTTQSQPGTSPAPGSALGASLIDDPKFDQCVPGTVIFSSGGSLSAGSGFLSNNWGRYVPASSGGGIQILSSSGYAGPNCCNIYGPSVQISRVFNVSSNLPIYIQVWAQSNGATKPLAVTIYWFGPNGGASIGSASVGSMTPPIGSYSDSGLAGVFTAPAGAGQEVLIISCDPSETATGGWFIGELDVQPVVQQTSNGQIIDTTQAAGSPNSAFRARAVATTALAIYGQTEMLIQDQHGNSAQGSPGDLLALDSGGGSASLSSVSGSATIEASPGTGGTGIVQAALGASHARLSCPSSGSPELELTDGTNTLTLTPTTSLRWNPSPHAASKAAGTTYQNTTGDLMMVVISVVQNLSGFDTAELLVGTNSSGISNPAMAVVQTSSANSGGVLVGLIPSGYYYYLSLPSVGMILNTSSGGTGWTEWY